MFVKINLILWGYCIKKHFYVQTRSNKQQPESFSLKHSCTAFIGLFMTSFAPSLALCIKFSTFVTITLLRTKCFSLPSYTANNLKLCKGITEETEIGAAYILALTIAMQFCTKAFVTRVSGHYYCGVYVYVVMSQFAFAIIR